MNGFRARCKLWLLGIGLVQMTCLMEAQLALSRAVATNRILVRPEAQMNLALLHQNLGARVLANFPEIGHLQIIEVPAGVPVDALLDAYRKSGRVTYAEADQLVYGLIEPNDYEFVNGDLWHLKNSGQLGGVVDADIDATDAWDTLTGAGNIVVAVLDSGIRATHEDLAPNLWRNPGEIAGNGIDDDANGYVDDVIGVNVLANNGNPDDDHGHGSHVAGILGAVGNNGVGVAGVCWDVQIMVCKFLDSNAIGTVSDAVKSIDYARANGAKIINLSWGDPSYASQALYDAIASARDAGIIVVCACGNSSANNDATPLYPASYDHNNIISVAATTRNDQLASFSSWGANTVDLGAPGQNIVSCWMGVNNNYGYSSGTSMAAPMVAGACALAWARFPTDNYLQIISRVVTNVDHLPALTGKCVSGGRLNIAKILASSPSPTLPAPFACNISRISSGSIALGWPSEPGIVYQVHSRSNLASGSWQLLSDSITATSTNTWWTNGIGGNLRFYRVQRMN